MDSLFNMIIILVLIIIILHNKDFSELINNYFMQTTLDKYFSSIKSHKIINLNIITRIFLKKRKIGLGMMIKREACYEIK